MPRSSSTAELYRNTQFGTVITFGLIAGLALSFFAGITEGWHPVLLAIGVILTTLLVLFYSLTSVVTGKELRLAFGPGVVRKSIPLSEIRSATPDRSTLLWGWGIRFRPGHGWMWNIAGFDIVKLDLPNGRQFRVGTNDPQGLTEAIEQAKAARRKSR
ncbi:MAG: hypothetical protein AAGE94_08640 [Acidobacteriota bacterium]